MLLEAALGLAALAAPLRFLPVARGIEYSSFQSDAGFRGHIFRVSIADVQMEIRSAGAPGQRQAVSAMVAPLRSVLATNASFFDGEGKAMGLVSSGGVASGHLLKSWGAFAVNRRGAKIVEGRSVAPHEKFDLLIQGKPFLVRNGVVPGLKVQRAERTAVCPQGQSFLLVVSSPVLASDFATFLAAPQGRGLGCRDALNLDGGMSTQLVAKFNPFTLDVPGGSGVPNALVITPRP